MSKQTKTSSKMRKGRGLRAVAEPLEGRRLLSVTNIHATGAGGIGLPLYAADTLPAVISGTVYRDLNGNHVPDPGEGEPFVVFEDANNNYKLDPGEPWIQSDANGNYQLTASSPGAQWIHVVVPDGWDGGQLLYSDFPFLSPSAPSNISAVPGQTVQLNLPVAIAETVSGVYFDDLNGDGQRQSSEPPLAGELIAFWVRGSGLVSSTLTYVQTDANGHYSTQLPIINPSNASFTLDPLVTPHPGDSFRRTTTNDFTESSPSDGKAVNVDFGSTTLAGISGSLGYLAQKGKAWLTDPKALAGWTVFIDKNQNGVLDKGDTSVKTQAGGSFVFPGQPVGDYTVRVIPHDSTFQLPKGAFKTLTIIAPIQYTLNFPVVKLWSVHGVLYQDLNKNRKYDNNEPLFLSRRVFVDSNSNGKWDRGEPSTLTDSKGHYVFNNLTTNQVTLDAVAPAGERAVEQTIKGSLNGSVNIALTTQSLVAGSLFEDNVYGNGVRDPGDSPPVGVNWTVWVDLNNNSTFDPGEPYFNQLSKVSDNRYQFMFENLRAGTYVIRAMINTSDPIFTTSDNYKVSIKPGQVLGNLNFGYYTN